MRRLLPFLILLSALRLCASALNAQVIAITTNANGSQIIHKGTNSYTLWPLGRGSATLHWATVQFKAPAFQSNAQFCALLSTTNILLPRSNWTAEAYFPNRGQIVMLTFSNNVDSLSHYYCAKNLTNGDGLLSPITLLIKSR